MKLDALIAKLGELYLSQGNVEVSVNETEIGGIITVEGKIDICGTLRFSARERYSFGTTDTKAIFSAAEFNDSL